MTEKQNTGGPAFPVAYWDRDKMRFLNDGMTLRDYFAAKAMQSIIEKRSGVLSSEVRFAYEVADAMLKERER